MSDIYLHTDSWILFSTCFTAGAMLLSLYVLRFRYFKMLAKHAAWQLEAQAVELATHEALINGLSNENHILSIVVPIKNEKESYLPLLENLFEQQYNDHYEIIVADESHSEDVKLACEQIQRTKFNDLRYTYVPDSSRHIEKRKLAITLGLRAARGEWVIVLEPETLPASNKWLFHFSQSLSDAYDLVSSYYNYEDDGTLVARRAIFDRVCAFVTRISAWEDEWVIDCPPSGWAVRKKWFLEQNGFADSVNMAFGEEAIFACMHANAERTCLLCSPSTRLVEKLPTIATLRTKRMQACEITHYLWKYQRKYHLQDIAATIVAYLFIGCQTLYSTSRLMCDFTKGEYTDSMLISDIANTVFWLAGLLMPLLMVRSGLKTLDERKYGAYIYLYDFLRPFHAIANEWRRSIHQQEFKRKFI